MPEDEREDEVEEGYRIVDKRKASAPEEPAADEGVLDVEVEAEDEEEPAQAPEPEEEEAEAPPEEEIAEPSGQSAMSLASLGVADLLRFAINLFAEQGWIHLGLRQAPGASDVKVDLVQARVAIETVRALGAQLEPMADDAERREVERIVANLQINFVQRSQ